jgi:hypothetical protein
LFMPIQSEPAAGLPAFYTGNPHVARILVSEDPLVSTFLRAILQRHGHQVIFGDAGYAGNLLREGISGIDLVITNAPWDFLPFAATLPILYIAANPDEKLAACFAHCQTLRKPFRNEDLLDAVEELARCVVP